MDLTGPGMASPPPLPSMRMMRTGGGVDEEDGLEPEAHTLDFMESVPSQGREGGGREDGLEPDTHTLDFMESVPSQGREGGGREGEGGREDGLEPETHTLDFMESDP